jgi:hypothetical protein
MAKTQDDIGCGLNQDSGDGKGEDTNKDAGKAVDNALNKAKTQAKSQRLAFLNFHCPPTVKQPKLTCSKQDDKKGDADDDLTPKVDSVEYDKANKKWTAKCTVSWSASFMCNEPK